MVNLDLPGGQFLHAAVRQAERRADAATPIWPNGSPIVLRQHYTPRHVPDKIIAVPDIPKTLTGKKMEVPVRKILMGVPAEKAANRSAMANPVALDFFIDYAGTQSDYARSSP